MCAGPEPNGFELEAADPSGAWPDGRPTSCAAMSCRICGHVSSPGKPQTLLEQEAFDAAHRGSRLHAKVTASKEDPIRDERSEEFDARQELGVGVAERLVPRWVGEQLQSHPRPNKRRRLRVRESFLQGS